MDSTNIIDKLESLSWKLFLEQMDEIIDRANAKNTSIIIEHCKQKILLVPASMFPSQTRRIQGKQQ